MPIWKAERGEGLVGPEDEATLCFVSAETFTLCRQEAEFNISLTRLVILSNLSKLCESQFLIWKTEMIIPIS